jgi:hypothetical protein
MPTPSASQGADTSAPPRCLSCSIIRDGRAPDVHVPLSAGGSQGLASNSAEVRRTVPELSRGRGTTLEPEGRSGPAPESAER